MDKKPNDLHEEAVQQERVILEEGGSFSSKPGDGKNKGTDLLSVIKGFFSSNPTNALTVATQTEEKMFIPLGIAHIILYGLIVLILPIVLLMKAFGPLGVLVFILPKGTMFFMGLLLGALSILVWAGLFKLIHIVHKSSVKFTSILNVVTVAILPTTFGFIFSLLFTFMNPVLSIGIITLTNFVTLLMLYAGQQRHLGVKSGPIWLFTISCLIFLVFEAMFISLIMMPAIISSILSNITVLVEELIYSLEMILENLGDEVLDIILNFEILGYKVVDLISILKSIIG